MNALLYLNVVKLQRQLRNAAIPDSISLGYQ